MTSSRSTWTTVVLAAALPVAVAALWIPVRERLSNTDLALLLVLVIGLVGWQLGTRAVLISALAAAVAFDVLDTRPYEALAISRGVDIVTALFLFFTGLLVGSGAARLVRYRSAQVHRSDALAVVMEASSLVATGEEQQLITEVLRTELRRALELVACDYHASPPDGKRPSVARDGSLVGLLTPLGSDESSQIDLPIWCQGEVIAHYRLTLGPKRPSGDELRVALSLADQAGAALAERDPLPPPRRPARLRLLTKSRGPDSGSADAPEDRSAPSPPDDGGACQPGLPKGRGRLAGAP